MAKSRNLADLNRALDNKIDEWHAGDSNTRLYDYIKMTKQEYSAWVEDSTKIPEGWENR